MKRQLFIVHGWAYSVEPWQQTISELAARDIDVTMLNVPGLTSPSNDVWTIDDYVAWLDTQLEGTEQPIVLGHSNGGRIAMHYAVAHPSRLQQLILLASAGVEVKTERLSLKRRALRLASKLLAPLKHIPYVKKIVYRILKSDYNNAPENMKQTLTNMLASDHDFDPSSITTPTVILNGENDRVTPPAMAKKLHTAIPNSTLRIVSEWEHAPYRTHPVELASEIVAALEQER
ncbi:alpha/beta hydrolase [Candidatus Saccharibacteria bacterium]|nr:alpha/beta hydrolase [Candidatus Saccharibacteria bacterium]